MCVRAAAGATHLVGPYHSALGVFSGQGPTDDEWRAPNIHEDTATGEHFTVKDQYGGEASLPETKVWFFHLARICNHCTYPGCLASCPRHRFTSDQKTA